MKILIGAPVQNREWIVKHWMDFAAAAVHQAGADPEFLLVGNQNDPTVKVAADHAYKLEIPVYLSNTYEDDRPDVRTWNQNRYHHMVALRNKLLGVVRDMNPDYFLSLDTDILANPSSVNNMMKMMGEYDAVGGKLYMTPMGTAHPSFSMLPNGPDGGLKRYEEKDDIEVDVIMAMKLMNHSAYHIDYQWAKQGEDIGWSVAAREAGLKLGWHGGTPNKHLMSKDAFMFSSAPFGDFDARCGY